MNDLRMQLARQAGYTGEQAVTFAGLLTGDTDVELAAHAAKLVEMAAALKPPAPAPVDPSQGHGGGGVDSPEAEMKRFGRNLVDRLSERPWRRPNDAFYNLTGRPE